MKNTFKVVIPARYGSTRLPGKPLLPIAGRPMVAHVCDRARQAAADQVVVATDDERIFDAVERLGIEVVMTDPGHQSGTERIAEVARRMDWPAGTVIVNLQGDEPLIPPDYINRVAALLAGQKTAGMATLAAPIHDQAELFNPNAVKVVVDKSGCALYFSRAPIPWERGAFPERASMDNERLPFLRHVGMYAYTAAFLQRYCTWEASPLEMVESLEQLRVLWQGGKIIVSTVEKTPEAGIDTPEDLQRVSQLLSAGKE